MEYFCWFGTKIKLSIMTKKNVGVVGNGKWAKIMLPKIAKFANIKFIANTKTGYKKFHLSKISWIFILTNNKTHFKIVEYFIKKKKNVFCEKPLTNNFLRSVKLFELSKRKKTRLYVNDVEFFKKKKISIKKNNLIVREKKSEINDDSLLHRFAYHDFYLLKKYIDIKDIKVKKYIENKEYLLIIFLTNDKTFKFIYNIKSKLKKHQINNVDMMKYDKDPLEIMIKHVLSNKTNLNRNFSNSLFSSKLISKINKKFY